MTHSIRFAFAVGAAFFFATVATGGNAARAQAASGAPAACSDVGITLPAGFCATVFADNLGHVRHMVVAPNGVVYVNTWSGVYYKTRPPEGGFLVALQDTAGQGRADVIMRFGDGVAQGSAGGTGIAFYKGAIYAEENDKIVRYALPEKGIAPTSGAQVVLSGLPLTGDHPMHPFVIDARGELFVDLGSATNSCQVKNRMPVSPGHQPCTELETRAGIWRYDADKTGQRFSPAERYATGIRNGEGVAFDADGRMFVTQHGRDQLSQNWPALYKAAEGPELPAEEVVQLQQGGDYGWPECYFDGFQKKLVLAPEYGGDGGKTVGVCAEKRAPAAFFPAHWGPNDLLIYGGAQFPSAYRSGAFIAFHGSWNRAPAPQGGYNVVFQPMTRGTAMGDFVVFADGFAGAVKDPSKAEFRPTGLAAAPDGALFISDDTRGRIWRVTYQGGNPGASVAAAPAPAAVAQATGKGEPPEGTHPDAGRDTALLPVPPGGTKVQVALGERVFHGEVGGGTCSGCHGSDAKGTPMGPDLTSGSWLWGDGSLKSIKTTIEKGVTTPKKFGGAMPPMGGAQLSPKEVAAVSAYVWAVGHPQH